MKMSGADGVLNPADRVVKCKSAHIWLPRYITAVQFFYTNLAFLSSPLFFYLFIFLCFFNDGACARGRGGGSGKALMLINNPWFFFLAPTENGARGSGASPPSDLVLFQPRCAPALIFASTACKLARAREEKKKLNSCVEEDGAVMQQDFTRSGGAIGGGGGGGRGHEIDI